MAAGEDETATVWAGLDEGYHNMPLAENGRDSACEAYEVLNQLLGGDAVTSLGSSEIWTETLARFYISLDMVQIESIGWRKPRQVKSTRE